MFPPSGTLVCTVLLSVALWICGSASHAQSPDTAATNLPTDADARMQWLKSRIPPTAPTPKPATAPKIGFRSSAKVVSTRPIEPEVPSEVRTTKPITPKATPAEPKAAPVRSAEAEPPKVTPAPIAKSTPAAKATPRTVAKATPSTPAPSTPKATPAETRVAKSSPAPSPKPKASAAVAKATSAAKATPTVVAKLTTPSPVAATPAPKVAAAEPTSTPPPKLAFIPAYAAIPATNKPANRPILPETTTTVVKGRYPWKTNIVTTVFWIGEPPGGNNFTPNRSSSWDANWTQSYGGYDNPDPAARRNFIPARFTPRQNPFYVALPYNDVTRGTTKPEARRVIPWFREAFQAEGRSVCRDRWVAIRNEAGRVAYAQWSDCGPFRTDHWQYVFGNEKPKPNLNKGAGLDVSPAVRDYLGLDGTDLTDWKFVDFADVPTGPWSRYGDNNSFVKREQRGPQSGSSKPAGRAF